MTRLRYFVDLVGYCHTWRLYNPDGWQGQVGAKVGPAYPTRAGARRWCVRFAWRLAGIERKADHAVAEMRRER